jgi:hypothetical protein
MRRSNRITPAILAHKRSLHHFLIWIMPLAVLILAGLACNLPSKANPASIRGMTLSQALAVTPRDDRPEILKRMGRPDAFKLTFATLDSKVVRYEQWSYFDDQACLDFMNGTLVSTEKLDPLPDGSIFASEYDPQSFQAGMSVQAVSTLVGNSQLVQLDTADEGVPGGLVMAGQQILFGFNQGQLVYVETLALTPQVNQ